VRIGSEAKELFVNHQAGPNGTRNALPLDATVLRDRHTAGWSAQASGTTYNRAYYCQNYFGGRGDVVAVLSNDGKLSQPPGRVRYSAYGVPASGGGLHAGDTDADGSIVATPDITQMSGWISGPYDVRGDLDLDGDVDSADMSVLTGNLGLGLGWNKLAVGVDQSLSGVLGGHRKGYCGYEHDWTNHSVMHVRNRAYFAELGRWTRRDPLGYVDGGNLFGYVKGGVGVWIDPKGQQRRWSGLDGGPGGAEPEPVQLSPTPQISPASCIKTREEVFPQVWFEGSEGDCSNDDGRGEARGAAMDEFSSRCKPMNVSTPCSPCNCDPAFTATYPISRFITGRGTYRNCTIRLSGYCVGQGVACIGKCSSQGPSPSQ
jgi:RHS repeat-associated protein